MSEHPLTIRKKYSVGGFVNEGNSNRFNFFSLTSKELRKLVIGGVANRIIEKRVEVKAKKLKSCFDVKIKKAKEDVILLELKIKELTEFLPERPSSRVLWDINETLRYQFFDLDRMREELKDTNDMLWKLEACRGYELSGGAIKHKDGEILSTGFLSVAINYHMRKVGAYNKSSMLPISPYKTKPRKKKRGQSLRAASGLSVRRNNEQGRILSYNR